MYDHEYLYKYVTTSMLVYIEGQVDTVQLIISDHVINMQEADSCGVGT